MDKKTQFNVWYFVAAMLGLFLLQALFTQMTDVQVLTYSRFKELAKEQQVENIVVTEHFIRGTLKTDSGSREFVTNRVDPAIAGSTRPSPPDATFALIWNDRFLSTSSMIRCGSTMRALFSFGTISTDSTASLSPRFL